MPGKIVFDLEADALLYEATGIHLLCFKYLGEGKTYICHDQPDKFPRDMSLEDGIDILGSADQLIGHNIAGYDLPLIEKLEHNTLHQRVFLEDIAEGGWVYDTMLASQLLHPKRKLHSLESWFGEEKVQNKEWGILTANIITRCISDVELTERLYNQFLEDEEKQGNDLSRAMPIEAADSYIQAGQEFDGMRVDICAANELHKELTETCSRLQEKIVALALKTIIPQSKTKYTKGDICDLVREVSGRDGITPDPAEKTPSWIRKIRTKAGKYTAQVTKWFDPTELKEWNVQGPFTRIEYRSLNLNSPQQLKDFLFTLGWKPTEWNYVFDEGKKRRTSPKLTEDSFDSIESEGLGADVKAYAIARHRRTWLLTKKKDGKLGGILAHVRKDGRVPASGITIGTPTFRYRHSVVVNTPSPDAPYGDRIRKLFEACQGCYMIGADLSGIEARELADLAFEYPGGRDLANLILDGDFHQHNANTWRVSRKVAKSILYALMYGAAPAKLGETSGHGEKAGQKIKDDFYEANPAISKLVSDMEAQYNQGHRHIRAIDGRLIYCGQKHKLLNRRIQGNSAIIFKKWKVNCFLHIPELRDGSVKLVINVHDEQDFEAALPYNKCVEVANKIVEQVMVTKEQLGVRVRLDAEAKIGANWYDIH